MLRQIAAQHGAVIVFTNPADAGGLHPVTRAVDRHINGVAAGKRFAQLGIDIHAVIAYRSQPFHCASCGSSSRKRASAWRA